jgi:two-component system, NtrC family, nitrogen regulation response regulator NtrX
MVRTMSVRTPKPDPHVGARPENREDSRPVVLLVDDDPGVRKALRSALADEGYRVDEIEDGVELLPRVDAAAPDLVLLDILMPGMDGITALKGLRDRYPDLPVVMMSGIASIERAVQATKLGAADFLEKPLSPERLLVTVERALAFRDLGRENAALQAQCGELAGEFQMVGDSQATAVVREAIRRVAPTHAKVLILGENGTGKELVARAIHAASPRARGPFIKVNCAAIPRDLVESELFGHERGAFTGATATRKGKFELADRGTLFLDEVGDMSLDAQAKLLRALETGEAERVGGGRPIRFDVRVIAATNKDLRAEIAAGRFREDLYYRLAVVPIEVPPLRERTEDIPLLAEHFLARACADNRRPRLRMQPAAASRLAAYDWPGNIRELRNLMERIAIMTDADELTESVLASYLEEMPASGEASDGDGDGGSSLRARLAGSEREVLVEELKRSGWNVSAAAKSLGIDRASLHRKMKRHGIARTATS